MCVCQSSLKLACAGTDDFIGSVANDLVSQGVDAASRLSPSDSGGDMRGRARLFIADILAEETPKDPRQSSQQLYMPSVSKSWDKPYFLNHQRRCHSHRATTHRLTPVRPPITPVTTVHISACRRTERYGLAHFVGSGTSPRKHSSGALAVPKDSARDRFAGDRRPRNGVERLVGSCQNAPRTGI